MFRKKFTRELPPGSVLLGKNRAKLPDGRRVEVNARGRWVEQTSTWYAKIGGRVVSLAPDKAVARELEAKLVADHLAVARGAPSSLPSAPEGKIGAFAGQWLAELSRRGRTAGDVATCRVRVGLLTRMGMAEVGELSRVDACDRIDLAIDALGDGGKPATVPSGQKFTPAQARHILGLTPSGLTKLARTQGVAGTGKGKARWFSRDEVTCMAGHRARGLSPQTRAHYRATIAAFCRWLVRRGHLARAPYLATVKVDRETRPRRIISWEECQKLADNSPPERSVLWRFAFCTMLRLRALRGLVVKDLHLGKNPHVSVRQEVDKTRRSRVVPIEPATAKDLAKLVAGRKPGDAVWELPTNLPTVLARDLRAAGIQPVTADGRVDVHALRHSGASHLMAKGISVAIICRMGGWTDPKMLVQRYGHLTPENLPGVWA